MIDEINKIMESIDYGWVDKNHQTHSNVDDSFSDNYILQSPDDLLKSKTGNCWDQVELERKLFEKEHIKFDTYSIIYYGKKELPNHTFIIYDDNGSYFWYEHSWIKYQGLHKFNSVIDALKDIKEKFINTEIKGDFNPYNLCIYKYKKPRYNISSFEFYKHIESGENIIV